jgi:alpha-tubulin suppressor-like RCC1 family protein
MIALDLFDLEEGKIWSWGRGVFGQLGTGDTETRYRPILIETISPDVVFTKISAGSDHSLAITGNFWLKQQQQQQQQETTYMI